MTGGSRTCRTSLRPASAGRSASWATWTRARQRLSIRAGARSWPRSHAPRVSLAVRLVRRIFARYRAGNDSDAGPVSASFARAARRVARDFTASGADRLSRIVNADDNSAYASGACALAPSRIRAWRTFATSTRPAIAAPPNGNGWPNATYVCCDNHRREYAQVVANPLAVCFPAKIGLWDGSLCPAVDCGSLQPTGLQCARDAQGTPTLQVLQQWWQCCSMGAFSPLDYSAPVTPRELRRCKSSSSGGSVVP